MRCYGRAGRKAAAVVRETVSALRARRRRTHQSVAQSYPASCAIVLRGCRRAPREKCSPMARPRRRRKRQTGCTRQLLRRGSVPSEVEASTLLLAGPWPRNCWCIARLPRRRQRRKCGSRLTDTQSPRHPLAQAAGAEQLSSRHRRPRGPVPRRSASSHRDQDRVDGSLGINTGKHLEIHYTLPRVPLQP